MASPKTKNIKESSIDAQSNRESKALISLGGTAITSSGRLTRSNFFRFIGHDLDQYDEIKVTPEQARKIHNHLLKLSTGSAAMVPMYCGGERCPFKDRCPLFAIQKHPLGKQCHPPGTPIYTTTGYRPIEELDPQKDKVVSYATSCGLFRKNGRSFQVGPRPYDGQLITFQVTSGNAYSCTSDHIAMAAWNEKARNLFAVYLMQKGDFFRVGKTKLFRQTGDKWYFGLSSRAQTEQCDKIWILGVYETNTEALLKEEYFSVTWQIPKACFVDRPCYKKTKKQEGLYKWVTQEQLDQHHSDIVKPMCHYASLLSEHGLDIRYPFWDRSADYRQLGSVGKVFEIRACNVIEKYMDMVVFDDGLFEYSKGKPEIDNRGQKETIFAKVSKYYQGLVYSLEVEKEHTYVASGILTHNCLIEVQLMKEWIVRYFEEYEVDPNNFTEVAYINELAEIEIQLMRLNMNLAKPENSELVIDQVVGATHDGTPLVQKDVSPFIELKDRLQSRRSKIIKLMVGDRQEQYKKEAALKVKMDKDPSSRMAAMRGKLETLARELDNFSRDEEGRRLPNKDALTPQSIIDADFEE